MPQSKLAFLRYLLIDRMIADKKKKYPTKQELLEACSEEFGVNSISTIEKDLFAMRMEFDAPIEYHATHRGYYYSVPDYRLMAVNLSEEQLLALQFVEAYLEEFKYLPIFNKFSDAVDKVLDGLQITRTFKEKGETLHRYIQIDRSQYIKGSDNLSQIISYITEKEVISIEYQKFGANQSKKYTIHPYLVKEYKDLWYLMGWVVEYQEVRTFAVDRIIQTSILEDIDFISSDKIKFDAESYYKYCIGVTISGTPQKIILSFTAQMGNYLKITPLHPTQEVLIDNEKELQISLYLIDNQEFRNIILSYGASVKVITPSPLKEFIKEEFKKGLERY
jgi:predicted DNA-binding transcriptional regulator YafY